MATQLEMAHSQLLHETEERVALERRLRESEHLAAGGNLVAGVARSSAAGPTRCTRIKKTRRRLRRSIPIGSGRRGWSFFWLGLVAKVVADDGEVHIGSPQVGARESSH